MTENFLRQKTVYCFTLKEESFARTKNSEIQGITSFFFLLRINSQKLTFLNKVVSNFLLFIL